MHGHDPAVAGAILLSPPLRFSEPRAPDRLGAGRQADDRARPRVRRLPAPGRGRANASRRSRRPRWSACRRRQAPVGRATPSGCSTRSSAGSRPAVPLPLPTTWDGPIEDRRQSPRTPTARSPRSRTSRWRVRRRLSPAAVPVGAQRSSWLGTTTSRMISWMAATIGMATSAPITPNSATPEQGGDHRGHVADLDRPAHHGRVDQVVLHLLVDDEEDDAGDAGGQRGGEADQADDDRADGRADLRDQVADRHHDGQRERVRQLDDQREDPACSTPASTAIASAPTMYAPTLARISSPSSRTRCRRDAGTSR